MFTLKNRLARAIVLIVVVTTASIGAAVWNLRVHQAAPAVFWDALAAGMTMPGITCTIKDGVDVNSSVQIAALDLASKTNLRLTTTLKQAGSQVTTDSIETKAAEYVRYTQFQTAQKNAAGQSLDFQDILNVWTKQAVQPSAVNRQYDKTAYGGCIVPLADITDSQKNGFMSELRKAQVFQTNFAASTYKSWFNGPTRSYQVTIQPVPYLTFIKKLASSMGSHIYDDVVTADYTSRQPEQLTFVIQANTHRLLSITNNSTKRTMTFSAYGVRPDTTPPTKTISVDELQQRLTAIK